MMKLRLALCVALALTAGSCGSDDDGGGPTGVPSPVENFDSGNLAGGGTVFVHTFTNNGDWAYRCKIHGGMTAVVRVSSAGVDSPVVNITNNTFTPPLVIVKPGSYVKWTNNGTTHTVTRP